MTLSTALSEASTANWTAPWKLVQSVLATTDENVRA